MPWYRTGTVAITAGQTTVVGTGVNFPLNARVGDAFQGPDGRWYEVAGLASTTVMSILPAYQGATVSGGSYGLAPMQGYVKESADRLRQLVDQFGTAMANLGTVSTENVVPVSKGGTGGTTQATARAGLNALGVGDYGVGSYAARWTGADADSASVIANGFYDIVPSTSSAWANTPFPGAWTRLLNISHNNSAGYWTQLAFNFDTNPQIKVRGMSAGVRGNWLDVLTANNGVTLDTTQEVPGQKTFAGQQLRHRSSTPGLWMSPTDTSLDDIWMVMSGNNLQWQRRANGFTSTLRSPTPMYIDMTSNLIRYGYIPTPGADNGTSLGGSSVRWSVVYAATGTINTSDAREKTPVSGLTADEVSAAKQLSKEIGTYKWLAAIQEKGEGDARLHVGMTVQRAVEIMENHGLDPMAYGFICYDSWDAVPENSYVEQRGYTYFINEESGERETMMENIPESGFADPGTGIFWEYTHDEKVVLNEGTAAGDRYSFRYDELNLFIAAGIEARLAALEEAVG